MQLFAVSGLGLVIAAVLAGYGFRSGISYFRSPTELLEAMPARNVALRLGGMVEAGSVNRTEDGWVEFGITDGQSTVPVRFFGILPDLFAENRGAIARGKFDGRQFQANEILAKHDENYMPREVVEAMKEQGVFRAVSE